MVGWIGGSPSYELEDGIVEADVEETNAGALILGGSFTSGARYNGIFSDSFVTE